MHDIDAMAERLFPDTGLISEEMRQAHILKWKKCVAYLGSRWLAITASRA